MVALAPWISSWIPGDDLLLKNAIEAGASLDSLAKGAVQFSREFTLRELQARCHSLLYDPVISDDASSRVIEFERSASTLSAGNLKDSKSLSGKRGVHSCYYAKRKRIRNEPFNSMDLSVNVMDCSFPRIQESSHVLGENQFLLESEEFPVDSLFEDNDSILKPSSSSDQINNDSESIFSEFEGNQVLNSPIVEWDWSIWRTDEGLSESAIPSDDGGLAKSNHVSGHNAVFTDSDIASGHNSLMIDEPFFLDIDDVKDVLDKSFFDSLSLLLASSPKASDRDQMIEATTIKTRDNLVKVSCSGLEESDGPCIPNVSDRDQMIEVTTIETQDNHAKVFFPGLEESDRHCIPKVSDRDQMIEVTTTETRDNLAKVFCSGLEESDGHCIPKVSDQYQIIEAMSIETQDTLAKMSCLDLGECTLNSEEPEIPCNEGVVLPKKLNPVAVTSTGHRKSRNPSSARNKTPDTTRLEISVELSGDEVPEKKCPDRRQFGKEENGNMRGK